MTLDSSTDDEPSDGPDYYYVLSGFSSLELFSELESLGIKANALFKVFNNLYYCEQYTVPYVCTCGLLMNDSTWSKVAAICTYVRTSA